MKILITGNNGFIGSNLEVGLTKGVLFSHHALNELTEIVKFPLDIRRYHLDTGIMKVDRIYHLAGSPSPLKYKKDPVKVIMTSVQGTYNILELARISGARVLFSSTIDTDRSYPSDHPRAAYTDSKKVAEDLCYLYGHDTDVRVARLFSTYGPGMKLDDGRVIPQFIKNALEDKPITIYGDGTQIDSFCYIDDMVQALHSLMEGDNPKKTVELGNPVIQGRSAGLTSIGELAETIKQVCNSKSPIQYFNSNTIDKTRIPDVLYANRNLGWYPKVGLREGIERTVEYFRGVMQ